MNVEEMTIFIPAQESYEIQNFIDGSILTISDAWAWIYSRFTFYYTSSVITAKRVGTYSSKNV